MPLQKRGTGSTVKKKLPYRQLLQIYTATLLVSNDLAENIDPNVARGRYIQYHRVIVSSTVESAQYIACHMYEIPKVNINNNNINNNENMFQEFEAKGDEEFFLVKYWSKADPPMVVMNQRGINDSSQINMNSTTLSNDIEESYSHSTNEFSLLAYNLAKSQHKDGQEWKLLKKVFDVGKQLSWDLYNFEDEIKEREAVFLKQGYVDENSKRQKDKLRLLLRICGGFTSDDPKQQLAKIESI